MGLLGIPTRKSNTGYKNNNYSNANAVGNLIRYITRTREYETRADSLIAYGAVGCGYCLSPEDIIQQLCYIQEAYGINSRKGRRMYHEVFNLYDSETVQLNYDSEQLWKIGMECCQVYYQCGFQAVFAVHWEESKRYHIHFAVSTINYLDGRKWHTSLPEIKKREEIFNLILQKHQGLMSGRPVVFFYEKKEGKERYGGCMI